MIDVYYFPTPNGYKVTIFLEEAGLEYQCHKVNILQGDQHQPEYLKLNPNNKMPTIVDHNPPWGGPPVTLFESGAILEYLADKTGKFLAPEGPERYRALQWVHWQMAGLGPIGGNAVHFKLVAPNIVDDPSAIEYPQKRFVDETTRLFKVMDGQLVSNQYLAGADYTIADMAAWGWANALNQIFEEEGVLAGFANVNRWLQEVGERPAVKAGVKYPEWLQEAQAEEKVKKENEKVT